MFETGSCSTMCTTSSSTSPRPRRSVLGTSCRRWPDEARMQTTLAALLIIGLVVRSGRGPGHRSAGRGGQPRRCGRHPEQRGHGPGDRPGWSPSARQRGSAGRYPGDPQPRVRVPVGGDAGQVGGSGGSAGSGVRGSLRSRHVEPARKTMGAETVGRISAMSIARKSLQRGHLALGIRASPGQGQQEEGRPSCCSSWMGFDSTTPSTAAGTCKTL